MRLDSTGLILDTQADLVTFLSNKYRTIYGADINLAPESPDTQMMMVYIQTTLDMQDTFLQIFNSFDPDNAIGRVLDQRASINGIQRQAGTYTLTFITVTVSQALTLFGDDQQLQNAFTVADNSGNKWVLQESISLALPGSYILIFRSEFPGAVLTVPNTITTPVSVILGVSSINNPTTYITLGLDEESDYDFKIRRQKSVSLASQGYVEGLIAALENISGMTSVSVLENNTNATDADGIPGNAIWVIVSGTALDSAIANAIYRKRNAGCGMVGAQQYSVSQPGGQQFVVRWDVVQSENLFIKFDLTPLDGVTPPNIAAIRAGLVNSFNPGVAQQVNINILADLIRAIDSNALVTNAGFSLTHNGTYTSTKTPSAKNKKFSISAPNIIITPLILNPVTALVANGATKQMSALGGYGTLTYSFQTNTSGGTINAGTGLYTAGPTDGVDVVKVTDSHSNIATANITVS